MIKKLIFLIVFGTLMLGGCSTMTYMVFLGNIKISPYTYRYEYDPTIGRDSAIATAYDSSAAYPIDSIFWKLEPKVEYTASGNFMPFSILNQAYAFKPNEVKIPLYTISDIHFVATTDYNGRYRADDTIDALFEYRLQGRNVERNAIVDAYKDLLDYEIRLKEKPEEAVPFRYRVIYVFEDSVYVHQESPTVIISNR